MEESLHCTTETVARGPARHHSPPRPLSTGRTAGASSHGCLTNNLSAIHEVERRRNQSWRHMSATVKVLNLVEACGVGTDEPSPALVEACGAQTGGPSHALVEACGAQTDGPSHALVVSQLLQAAMLRLTNTFLDDVKGTVDYVALRHSQEYREYRTLATRLQEVDVSTLDDNEKKAFFINVYNALTMESVSQLEELPASTLEVDHFWTSSAYLIGPHSFTLDQIEHGILRGNKSHPSTGSPVLPAGDPRLQYSVRHLDPRVHFALNCGAKTCPVVRVYSGKNLEQALEAATRSYLSQEVKVKEGVLWLPQVIQWYEHDFSHHQHGVLRWIQGYVEDAERAAISALLTPEHGTPPSVRYFYDWSLNTS